MTELTLAGICLLLMVLLLARRVHNLERDVDGWRAHVGDLYGDIEDLKAAVYGGEECLDVQGKHGYDDDSRARPSKPGKSAGEEGTR